MIERVLNKITEALNLDFSTGRPMYSNNDVKECYSHLLSELDRLFAQAKREGYEEGKKEGEVTGMGYACAIIKGEMHRLSIGREAYRGLKYQILDRVETEVMTIAERKALKLKAEQQLAHLGEDKLNKE